MEYRFCHLIVLVGLLLNGLNSNGQFSYPKVLPPTPEVAAFGKNIDIPVGYTSGTPGINVPIYTVRSGSLEIPVSLSYNASGIRVEESATWVGLGWNLNTGGTISRSVRGLPDDKANGYISVPNNRKVGYVYATTCYCTNPDQEEWDIENEIQRNELDLEPDEFTFSIMGYSGKFHYDQDSSKFVFAPYQNIKLESPLGISNIAAFKLTLPNGVVAVFGGDATNVETLAAMYTYSFIDGVSNSPTSATNTPYNTAWALSELYDPTGKSITFQYMSFSVVEAGRGGETYADPLTGYKRIVGPGYKAHFNRQTFYKPVLQKITGEYSDIYFKRSSTDRLDAFAGSKSLDTILVKAKNQDEIKSFYLGYEYTTSASQSFFVVGLSDFVEIARKRLILKSVTEKGPSLATPPFEFTYSGINLPTRLSTSQDFWGYYNGKPNGNFIMPRFYNRTQTGLPEGYWYFSSADRRIDSAYNQAGILTQVKYPTGGTTKYTYECNTAPITMFNTAATGMELPDLVQKTHYFSNTSIPSPPTSPPYDHYFTEYFTVTRPQTKTYITSVLPTCNTVNDLACTFAIVIKSLPDSTTKYIIRNTSPFYAYLPEGNYQIEAFVQGTSNDPVPNFSVNLSWGEQPDPYNFKVGGLRVKKIVSDDGLGNKLSRSYSYLKGNTSSGSIIGCPVNIIGGNLAYFATGEYYVSNSPAPLTSDGQTVVYDFVSEFYDSTKSSYKTDYTFLTDLTNTLVFGPSNFGVPTIQKSWRNGLLLRKQSFEKIGPSSYRLLVDENNFYQSHELLEKVYGLAMPQLFPYEIAREWYLLDSTYTIRYNYEGSTSTIGTKNYYNDRYLLSGTRTRNSAGKTILSKSWYPSDYNDVSGFSISALLQKNILEQPIRSEMSVDGKVIRAFVTKYAANGIPIEMYKYENSSLISSPTFDKNVVLHTNYNLNANIYYDSYGHLKQVKTGGNSINTYIWDMQTNFPIAEIKNADTASVAYTSFEGGSLGNWNSSGMLLGNGGLTGESHCSATGFSFSKTSLNSGVTYLVTYWSKNGSYSVNGTVSGWPKTLSTTILNGQTWTCYEHSVTGQTTISVSGTGAIDELRLMPSNAMMTTYTYRLIGGISSICSPNNTVTYYQYDGLNRLYLIRDKNNNILKKFCYNYAGQQTDCGQGTEPNWQALSTNCQQSSGANNGYQEVFQKDLNPSSATYNQTRTITIWNTNSCPVCIPAECTGANKKCINNNCETGVRVNTSSVRLTSTTWRCYYHYEWSDGNSSPTYDEVTSSNCMFQPLD